MLCPFGVRSESSSWRHASLHKEQIPGQRGARHCVQSWGHCPCGQLCPGPPSFLPFPAHSFSGLGLTFLLLSSKTCRFTTQMGILKRRKVKGPERSEGLVSLVKDLLEQNDSEALWIWSCFAGWGGPQGKASALLRLPFPWFICFVIWQILSSLLDLLLLPFHIQSDAKLHSFNFRKHLHVRPLLSILIATTLSKSLITAAQDDLNNFLNSFFCFL